LAVPNTNWRYFIINTNNNSKSAEKKLKLVLLYCQNCVANNRDINLIATKAKEFTLRTAVLPCSSKIQAHIILKILDNEADGVEIVVCPDEKCHFLAGSIRAKKRVEYVRRLLDEIGVGTDRVGLTQEIDLSCDDLIEIASRRIAKIKSSYEEGDNL